VLEELRVGVSSQRSMPTSNPNSEASSDEDKVRSCADVECGDVQNEGFWERL